MLAGCGHGKDEPPLDDTARTRWRKQAIDWLKADVAARTKILESGSPQLQASIAETLPNWKADPELAGLRDPGSLAKLPKDEQDACRILWKEVDALLARAGGGAARERRSPRIPGGTTPTRPLVDSRPRRDHEALPKP